MDNSDEPPERSRAARRALTTRQRLLSAALTVINSRGFDGCAIEDITELADVGKGTFYRHFKEKAAILADLFEVATGDILARIQAQQKQLVSLDSAVTLIFSAHTKSYMERRDLFLLFLQAQNMASTRAGAIPALEQTLLRYFKEIDNTIAPFLPQGTDEGKRRRLSCAMCAASCGFIAFALTGMQAPQDMAANLEAVGQSLLAAVPRLVS
jgi:AcrR family transcriptional regulator